MSQQSGRLYQEYQKEYHINEDKNCPKSKPLNSRYNSPSSDLLYETQSAQELENRYRQEVRYHRGNCSPLTEELPARKNMNSSLAKLTVSDDVIKHCSICGITYLKNQPWENPSCYPCSFCLDKSKKCTQPYNQQLLLGFPGANKSSAKHLEEYHSNFELNQRYKEQHKGESCPAVQIMEEETGEIDWYLRERQGEHQQINIIKILLPLRSS